MWSQVKKEWSDMKEKIEATRTLATNHMQHIQDDVKALCKAQEESNQKTDKIIEVLGSIDKGIAVLVDRH